jgi:hypothetical protein
MAIRAAMNFVQKQEISEKSPKIMLRFRTRQEHRLAERRREGVKNVGVVP